MPIVMGIDPGLRHTGWAVIAAEGNTVSPRGSGTINPAPKSEDAVRLATLQREVGAVIDQFAANYAGVERTIVNVNALSSLRLGQARGVILAALGYRGIPVGEYSPREIKQALGSGKADKQQLSSMVRMLLPAAQAETEHAADAYAVALVHLQHLQWQTKTEAKP